MELPTFSQITANYLQELKLSEQGRATSFAFIRNTIATSPLVQNGETFQVMAVGGSIFRTALVRKHPEYLEILGIQEVKLPQLATKEIFLSFITQYIESSAYIIAINFAFALHPVFENGKLEGVIPFGSKEHAFEGLIGKNICTELEAYVAETKRQAIRVSVANDTICLLLSGLTKHQGNNLAAGIIGTGFNFALFLDKETTVNLESGGFSNFTQTETGKKVDEASLKPGHFIFEKEIAGSYLYKHFNRLVTEGKVDHDPLSETAELDHLARTSNGPAGDVARKLLKQSAGLAACAVAAITNFQKQNMTFVMQGSVFWKGYEYKETVEEIAQELTPDYDIAFISVKDSDLLGAAKLVA